MTALRVAAGPDAQAAGDVGLVVASLPISLVAAETGTASDLVAVDGGPGWPQRATDVLRDGVRGLLIVHPVAVPPAAVPDASFVPVVLDYRFAGNPVLPAMAKAFADWSAEAMIEVAAVVHDRSDLDRALVDQLATLRRVGQPAATLARLAWGSSGYYLSGRSSQGSPLLLSAHVTTGAPSSLRIRGLAADVAVEATLPDPATARPAVLVRTTPSGAITSPTLWETSHRTAWRRLHAVATGGRLTSDLSELRTDLTVAGNVLTGR
ncbi:MAG TPA: hypothetical protein VFJ97_12785 [Dermatophilaceae bacterium]|nr:hypothetical protein [Dermatophilaceae bacterium]